MNDDKVICRTPTVGKEPTRIDGWKFDTVRRGILAALPEAGDGLAFKELSARVRAHLDPGTLARLGSVSWYTTTVKLELEVRGEVVRTDVRGPQRLRRTVGLEDSGAGG
jgi:hypothetical protein